MFVGFDWRQYVDGDCGCSDSTGTRVSRTLRASQPSLQTSTTLASHELVVRWYVHNDTIQIVLQTRFRIKPTIPPSDNGFDAIQAMRRQAKTPFYLVYLFMLRPVEFTSILHGINVTRYIQD